MRNMMESRFAGKKLFMFIQNIQHLPAVLWLQYGFFLQTTPTESEKNKLDIRDHLELILLQSHPNSGYKYPPQKQSNIYMQCFTVMFVFVFLPSLILTL